MIELVLPTIVASDDARLGGVPRAETMGSWRWDALSRDLELPVGSARTAFDADPQAVRRSAKARGPLSTLHFAACLSEALLDATVDLARSRKSQDKMLLSYQAVALRIADLYLALQCIDQVVDAKFHEHDAQSDTFSRRRFAAEQLLTVLRNAAQVMAGHGYVDNEAFAAMHQATLDTTRDLIAEIQP